MTKVLQQWGVATGLMRFSGLRRHFVQTSSSFPQRFCSPMKTISLWILLCLLTWRVQAQTAVNATATPVSKDSNYQIVQRDGNSQVWQRTTYETAPDGTQLPHLHQYTELASGLNHWVNGQWVASSEHIDILPDGTAAATNGQHQAYFPGDIYEGQIELVTPDGQHLYSRPLGLGYDDGTNTVLIAELTNSLGEVAGDNQVVYPNAFVGIKADLRYTYTKAGFEQDIIIREQPPAPEDFGMETMNTKLQLLTEFFNPPQPKITANSMRTQAGTITDDNLSFGAMQMVPGKAFMMGTSDSSVMVNKLWVNVQNRQFLVEEVLVDAVADDLLDLPQTTTMKLSPPLHVVAAERRLPSQHLAKANGKAAFITKTTPPDKGLVLDYNTVNSSLTNYTFQGDSTYYISGTVNLFGTNTFEGGAVIKYTNNATIHAITTAVKVNWQASAYRPVIFTAKDDNTVGENITGSTGAPSGYYANPALEFVAVIPSPTLSYFRVSYAQQAITLAGALTFSISNGQIVNCQNGITANSISSQLLLENMLFANVQTNFNSMVGSYFLTTENTTFSSCAQLINVQDGITFTLTNCLLANVNSLTNSGVILGGDHNGFYNSSKFGTGQVTDTFYPFQTVGAGSYYLTNGCNFFNAGTTNIDSTLLASLKQKTTYPPIVYSNVVISNSITLSPRAQRDTDTPDLGYHYDPLDYVFGDSFISNANVTVTSGTAIGVFVLGSGYGDAIELEGADNLLFEGVATNPIHITYYNAVQEQPNTNWTGFGTILEPSSAGDWSSEASFRFTQWSSLAGQINHFRDENGNRGFISFKDCEFYNGGIYDLSDDMAFTNCLFNREYVRPDQDDLSIGLNFTMENCLMWRGTLDTYYDGTAYGLGGLFIFQNNLFDQSAILNEVVASPNNDHNAYVTNCDRLSTNGTGDITLPASLVYQAGPFGIFYQPTNSPLINMGNTTADQMGLYHYTTQTNQTVEGTSVVDIGYHYVATDAYGNPLDNNGDGLPDYLQDANGNGLVDPGETGWDIIGDLTLKIFITKPRNTSTLP
ncbi:MAG TPA: hypothetical protein VHG71_06150 [Verrucomicrobiae bacterium]|nr:hypothetical protein [Verrucomicrobiae bacterium]